MKHTNWWKEAIFYQIYPRSFKDNNNDGLGDIQGIISKLDYLKDLGINAIWLSPVYDSPQEDNGYDIANYRDIYPPFGTLMDMKKLIKEAHARGIRIVMDLVVNHTSSKHEWFQKAITDVNSSYRDYYIIKKGKKNGEKAPNKWGSCFGGSAWERIPNSDEYYLHLFAKGQPDLNWENPKVRQEVIDILRFWMDLGIDGFRCDVINLISKDQRFKNGFPIPVLRGKEFFINGPRLHEYLHLLYEKAYADYDVMTVGETMLSKPKQVLDLVNPERQELDMVFNFKHTDVDNFLGVKYFYRKFKLTRFKKRLSQYQYLLANNRGWNSLFIENHDQRRSAGRYGTDLKEYREKSAKALATAYFLLQGTPFIYQGQEIGMQNLDSKNIDDFRDIEIKNMYAMSKKHKIFGRLLTKHLFEVGRDNARTPMQWNSKMNAGFSDVTPWIKVNENKSFINVEDALANSDSIYHYYQKLIKLRKELTVIKDGKYQLLYPHHRHLFIYTRETEQEKLCVIVSFAKKTIRNPLKKKLANYELRLTNEANPQLNTLAPYEARVYYQTK